MQVREDPHAHKIHTRKEMFPMTSVTIPGSLDEATAALGTLGQLLTAKQWERAAILAAYVEPRAGQGERTDLSTSSGSRGSRVSATAFATYEIVGLRDVTTVLRYVTAWRETVGTIPEPGQEVDLPEIEWGTALADIVPPPPPPPPQPPEQPPEPQPPEPQEEEPVTQTSPMVDAARTLTEEIKEKKDAESIIAAHQEKVWRTLGYRDWRQYVEKELDGKVEPEISWHAVVMQLRDAGLSPSAIAEVLGMGRTTVRSLIDVYQTTGFQPRTYSATSDPPFVRDMEREIGQHERQEEQAEEHEEERATVAACKPVVIYVQPQRMPSWYAEKVTLLLDDLDDQHYGPDVITAEQVRVLDNLRAAMREFAVAWAVENENATQ